MSLTTILILLYIDDRAIPFISRQDAILGLKLCIDVFAKFGLIIHTGTKKKTSKTKAVFFPGTNTIHWWRRNVPQRNEIECNSYTLGGDSRLTCPNYSEVKLEEAYKAAPETADIVINSNETIPFVSNFCYLDSMINFLLNNTTDIKSRITKASKAARDLGFVWKSSQISLETKVKLFLAIPVNLALWNCETWLGNNMDLKLLNIFVHKTIRRILGISMVRIRDEHISNAQLCTMFSNIGLLSDIMRFRLLKFVGKTIR